MRLLDIPVVGHGESAMLTACMLGRTFGVLVFIDEWLSRLTVRFSSPFPDI
ncbi:aspartate/glutamate racemase family protein [Pseudomonas moorei]|uniref:aspartate/glutamate racemase family protein n=1 Tax=Pseudomonas moorei TaxID=395599 RepID=UPI00200ECB91|nr:aspartate/glutamate racemase family protein [Pseudomonas moorei]